MEQLARVLGCEVEKIKEHDPVRYIDQMKSKNPLNLGLRISTQQSSILQLPVLAYDATISTEKALRLIHLEETYPEKDPFQHVINDENGNYVLSSLWTITKACEHLDKRLDEKIRLIVTPGTQGDLGYKRQLENMLNINWILENIANPRKYKEEGEISYFLNSSKPVFEAYCELYENSTQH